MGVRIASVFGGTAKAITGSASQQRTPNVLSTRSAMIRGRSGLAQPPEFGRLVGAS